MSEQHKLPTEPGLYWASYSLNGQYDTILRIYGEAPFLRSEVIPLPVSLQDGTERIVTRGTIHALGPKVDIPSVDKSDTSACIRF